MDMVETLRCIRGLSMRTLAARSGIHRTTLDRYMAGKAVPRVDHLDKLLRVTGWELRWLPNGVVV